MRTVAALAALGSAVALTADARPVSAAAPPINFHATLSGTVTATGGNCCFLTADFTGSGVVPTLGRVTFTGEFAYLGTPGQTQPCELTIGIVPCEQALFLQLTTPNGREVTIRGDDFWSPPAPAPAAWSWVASGDTVSGAGTYVTNLTSGAVTGVIGQPFKIALSGTLTHT
jgi:hypothetical protein